MNPIRIILADDHPLLRAGVRSFLEREADLQVIAEAASGPEALHLVRTLLPDVLILDMEMPGLHGLDVAHQIHEEALPVHILALSAYDDPTYVAGLWESGASGYITKEKPSSLVVEAVRAVANGEGRWFVKPAAQLEAHDALPVSEREREVLKRMARGLSNAQIGDELGISENTVKNHVRSIYAKLGVTSSREAVAWAWQHGLVQRG